MATKFWIGNAQDTPEIWDAVPANIEVGDLFRLTINEKTIEVEAVDTLAATVIDDFVDAITESTIPEWQEVDAKGKTIDGTYKLRITSKTEHEGKPITITASTAQSGLAVVIAEVRKGSVAVNEKQTIQLALVPTGGTFTLSIFSETTAALAWNVSAFDMRDALCNLTAFAGTDEVQTISSTATGGTFTLTFEGQTTGAIAFNATAATIKTALEALSNVEVDDVSLTGGPLNTTAVVVTFKANLGRSDRTQMTVDNTSMTGGTASVATTTAGVASDVTITRAGSGTTASPYIWTVEFKGAYAGVNVPLFTGNGSLLTGITGAQYITHATTTQGGPGVNEKQTIALSNITLAGTFKVSLVVGATTYTSDPIAGSASAATVQTALAAGGITPTTVTKDATDLNKWTVEFQGAFGQQNLNLMTGTVLTGSFTITITETQAGSSTGVNEVQTVTLNGAPTGGTFTLTFQGQTTAANAFDIAAATLTTNLEALSNIGVGDVSITRTGSGTVSSPYKHTITFQGALASTDVAQLTSTSSLTGCGIVAAESQAAAVAVNEQQSVTLDPIPSGGTFTLTSHQTETTAGIAYNATAAAVQTAIDNLATPVAGDVVVTGPDGGPWILEFKQAYAGADIALWTGSGASLTGTGTQTLTLTHPQTASGKSFWDNVKNWSDGIVPVSTDTVHFSNSDVSALYAIDQNAVTLTAMHVEQSYTGRIGLPDTNEGGYYEWRNKELKISVTTLTFGAGNGDGCPFARINVGSNVCTLLVYNTGTPVDGNVAALYFKGSHTDNAGRIYRGYVAVGWFATETSRWETLELGREGEASDVFYFSGSGVTYDTSITKFGGTAEINSACPTILNVGGDLTMTGTGGASGTIRMQEGILFWNSSGNIGTVIVSANATFDNRGDSRTFTITTVQLHSGASFYAPSRNVTYTNPIQLVQCSLEEVTLHLGTNISLAPAAL